VMRATIDYIQSDGSALIAGACLTKVVRQTARLAQHDGGTRVRATATSEVL
jgi:hypothetical protein